MNIIINPELLYTLEGYYYLNKEKFLSVLNGTGITSSIYKKIINETMLDILSTYKSNSASVIKLDMDGNVLFSDTSSKFANNKNEIKSISASVGMVGNDEIAVADSINKVAKIISMSPKGILDIVAEVYYQNPTPKNIQFINDAFAQYKDISAGNPEVIWEYTSDKFITGFRIMPTENITIEIRDDSINPAFIPIRQFNNVTWINNSSSPVSIYSGTTTYDLFQASPNLNLYGQDFKSGVLDVGETYTYKFVSVGDMGWFVYPSILNGIISVTTNRVSSEDTFLITENDGLDKPFSSRVIKIDSYGNILWSFAECYIPNSRAAKPLLNNNIII